MRGKAVPRLVVAVILLSWLPASHAGASEEVRAPSVFLEERFEDLDRWKPLTFPKIKEHSSYRVVSDGADSLLRAESDSSASGLVLKETFDVRRHPLMRWRWKVGKVYAGGDVTRREGDDYPVRVYILFAYDPARAGLGMRLKYGAARLVYGEYPPHSSLNYIWANREEEKGIYRSPYTDRSVMIPLESGPARVGEWVSEEVDILRDYRRAFGEEPPDRASLAIMNDSDNTGEAAVSWLDDLVVFGHGE